MKVSVLVAVYNAEQTIASCLNSLLAQTHQDLQILCVDDCSQDGSWTILQDFARCDSRILIFHLKENRGQAHARNVALAHADGDLIAFLDSDDTMADNAIEQVVEVFQSHPQTGCVLLKVVNCLPDGKHEDYPMEPFVSMSGYDAFLKSLTWDIHGWYVARSQLYKDYPFDETCKSYSDDNTTRIHYFHSTEVRTCAGIYYYRLNPSSVTHAPSLRRFDYLRANESMKKQLIDLGVGDEVLNIYETVRWRVVVDSYMFYFLNRNRMQSSDRSAAIQEIRRVWGNVELPRVDRKLRHSFGFIPFRPSFIISHPSYLCWLFFRLQEELYFSLRQCLKRLSSIL